MGGQGSPTISWPGRDTGATKQAQGRMGMGQLAGDLVLISPGNEASQAFLVFLSNNLLNYSCSLVNYSASQRVATRSWLHTDRTAIYPPTGLSRKIPKVTPSWED